MCLPRHPHRQQLKILQRNFSLCLLLACLCVHVLNMCIMVKGAVVRGFYLVLHKCSRDCETCIYVC